MKKIIILVITLIIVTGCGEESSIGGKENLNFADNLYVKIDGVKYEVDTNCYETLRSNGWNPDPKKYDESKLIIKGKNSNKYNQTLSDVKFVNDDYSQTNPIYVTFKNEGNEDIYISEGKCDAISFTGTFSSGSIEIVENIPEIEMPGGLKIGSTKEELEKVFGQPNSKDSYLYIYGKIYTEGYYKFKIEESLGIIGFEIYKNVNL